MANDQAYWLAEGDSPTNGAPQDDRLPVQFYAEAVYDKLTTEGGEITPAEAKEWLRDHPDDPRAAGLREALTAKGRHLNAPVLLEPAGRVFHREVEFVKIGIPGKIANIVVHKVKPHHRARFARQYAAFKAGKQQETASGTPLAALLATVPPILRPTQVKDFEAAQVHTVEQLIAMPDVEAQRFMGFHDIRRKAEAYLEGTKEEAPRAALRIENEKLRGEVEAMRALMEEQGQVLAQLQQQQKKAPKTDR